MEYNENNSQINTFTGGMNSDTAYHMMKDSEYILAENLRVLSLTQTNGTPKINSQGEIRPIEGIRLAKVIEGYSIAKILAAGSIRNYGVIIFEDKDGKWGILRFENAIGESSFKDDTFNKIGKVTKVFGLCEDKLGGPDGVDKVSINLTYEDGDDNIKLYIADGYHPILVFNIHPKQDGYNQGLNGDIDKVSSYPKIVFDKPIFVKVISGNIKAGLVQYAYQFYNKNGISTDISPATKLIPIVKNTSSSWRNGLTIKGINQDDASTMGVQLKISIPEGVNTYLPYVRVYRIHYAQNGQLPTIELIQDAKLNAIGNKTIVSDYGQTGLSYLTVEEYNSMSGMRIIPKVIESKDGYLFAADVIDQDVSDVIDVSEWDSRAYRFDTNGISHLYNSDGSESITLKTDYTGDVPITDFTVDATKDCINKYNDINIILPESPDETYKEEDGYFDRFDRYHYYGGEGENISWRFVVTELCGDSSRTGGDYSRSISGFGNRGNCILRSDDEDKHDTISQTKKLYYIYKDGTKSELSDVNAGDFYEDQTGVSNTYSDIIHSTCYKSLRRDELYRYGIVFYDENGNKTPVKWIADIRTPSVHYKGFQTFLSNPISTIRNGLSVFPLGIIFKIKNMPEGAVAYEIVRCNRTPSDIATISQGVVSRPIKRHANETEKYTDWPYTPTGFLTTAQYWAGEDWKYRYGSSSDGREADNIDNKTIFQFVSPEVSFTKDSIKDLFKNKNLYVNSLLYLFGSDGKYNKDVPLFGEEYSRNKVVSFDEIYKRQTLRLGVTNCNLFLPPNPNDNISIFSTDTSYLRSRFNWFTILDRNLYNLPTYYQATPAYTQDYFDFKPGTTSSSVANSNEINENYDYIYSCGLPIESNNDVPHIYSKGGKGNRIHVKKRLYGYIKLYEQARFVHCKAEDPDTHNMGRYSMSALAKAPINGIAVAEDLGWNDIVEKQSSDNSSYVKKYENFVIGIKSSQYCNAVLKGEYGNDVADMIDSNNPKSIKDKNYPVIGVGGRCAIMEVDDNWTTSLVEGNAPFTAHQNLFATTMAAINRRQEEQASAQSGSPDSMINDIMAAAGVNDPGELSYFDYIQPNEQGIPAYYIYRDSIAGTYLCNIRQQTRPYGGDDYMSRTVNTYSSHGYYRTVDKSSIPVFDGDCVIMPFEYTSMHKVYSGEDKATLLSTTIMYSIPVETDINLAYTSGYEFSRNTDDIYASNLQIEPSKVYNTLEQDEPEYVYNTAYSATDKIKVFASEGADDEHNKHLDYRCFYSNYKTNDERIDSWTKFQPANFIDVDTRYGAITHLRTFHNKLVYWQQHAVGVFSVNERSTITDNSNMPLILGAGGILTRYDYTDNTSGMHKEQFCDTQSHTGLYWFDDDNQEIKAYSDGGGLEQLSKKHRVQNLMHKHAASNNIPTMFFDKRYNEIVANVLDNRSIVYSEQLPAFSAMYTIPFNESISFFNGTYVLNVTEDGNINIGQWNTLNKNGKPCEWNGDPLATKLSYVVNSSPTVTKVFDSQQMVTADGLNGIDIEHPEEYDFMNVPNDIDTRAYFNNHHTYTWVTELNNSLSTLEGKVTLREGNYEYAIPRQDNAAFGNRIRGKYMICTINDNNPVANASLSYVITKFRKSWS